MMWKHALTILALTAMTSPASALEVERQYTPEQFLALVGSNSCQEALSSHRSRGTSEIVNGLPMRIIEEDGNRIVTEIRRGNLNIRLEFTCVYRIENGRLVITNQITMVPQN